MSLPTPPEPTLSPTSPGRRHRPPDAASWNGSWSGEGLDPGRQSHAHRIDDELFGEILLSVVLHQFEVREHVA
jgi:hypothetical protein